MVQRTVGGAHAAFWQRALARPRPALDRSLTNRRVGDRASDGSRFGRRAHGAASCTAAAVNSTPDQLNTTLIHVMFHHLQRLFPGELLQTAHFSLLRSARAQASARCTTVARLGESAALIQPFCSQKCILHVVHALLNSVLLFVRALELSSPRYGMSSVRAAAIEEHE